MACPLPYLTPKHPIIHQTSQMWRVLLNDIFDMLPTHLIGCKPVAKLWPRLRYNLKKLNVNTFLLETESTLVQLMDYLMAYFQTIFSNVICKLPDIFKASNFKCEVTSRNVHTSLSENISYAMFETQTKRCKSSCVLMKKNQQKVPGPLPNLSASDWWACVNFQYWSYVNLYQCLFEQHIIEM